MKRILLAVILISYIGFAAFGQAPASRPSFEVASIKLAKDADGSDTTASLGLLRMQGTLKSLIRVAYGVSDNQIESGPKWIEDDHYVIDAKAEGPANTPQLYEMLQALLANRFKLDFHREARTVSGYALVVTKGGLKLTEVPEGTSHSTSGNNARGVMSGKNVTIARLANKLSNLLGQPVADETGNLGFFDINLTWDPVKSGLSLSTSESRDNAGPSIFTALEEQLGLKLETRKVPLEILVIDHAEKPQLD